MGSYQLTICYKHPENDSPFDFAAGYDLLCQGFH